MAFQRRSEFVEEVVVDTERGEEIDKDARELKEFEAARSQLAGLSPLLRERLGITLDDANMKKCEPEKRGKEKSDRKDEKEATIVKEEAEEERKKRKRIEEHVEMDVEPVILSESSDSESGGSETNVDNQPSENYADSDESESPEGSSEGHSS